MIERIRQREQKMRKQGEASNLGDNTLICPHDSHETGWNNDTLGEKVAISVDNIAYPLSQNMVK